MHELPQRRKSEEQLRNIGSRHLDQQRFIRRMAADVPKASKALIVTGYVFAFLGGIVGLVIGAVVLSKPDSKHHGGLILLISVVCSVFWSILSSRR